MRIRSFLDLVEAPVEAVEVEVDEGSVGGDVPHVAERVVAEGIVEPGGVGRAAEVPGEVLRGAEVDFVELGAVEARDRVVDLRVAVLGLAEHAEGVLRVQLGLADAAPDSDARVDVESLGSIRVDPLDGGGLLESIGRGVGVDARRPEQVRQVGGDGHGRNRKQRVVHEAGVPRVVHDVGIHLVVNGLHRAASRGGQGPRRGWARRWLEDHLVREDVGLRVHVGGEPARHVCECAQGRRSVDRDRSCVDRAVGLGGGASVKGVPDGGARRRRGDVHLERRVEEPALDVELSVLDDSEPCVRVRCPRGCRLQVARRGVGAVAVGDVRRLRRVVVEPRDHRRAAGCHEEDVLAVGVELVARVDVAEAVDVRGRTRRQTRGADDEVPVRGDGRRRGEGPLGQVVLVVGHVGPGERHGRSRGVVELHPVGIAAGAIHEAVAVARHELVHDEGVHVRGGTGCEDGDDGGKEGGAVHHGGLRRRVWRRDSVIDGRCPCDDRVAGNKLCASLARGHGPTQRR